MGTLFRLLRCALACLLLSGGARGAKPELTVRVATFNVSLYDETAGEVLARLKTGTDPQAQRLAEIIQRVRPDVLLINEIDYDVQGETAAEFCDRYLAVGQNVLAAGDGGGKPIEFPHRFVPPTNTGEHSGLDISRNGHVDAAAKGQAYALDCFGFGLYPGQYGFAVLSRFPIDQAGVRQFRTFLWRDMPAARLPDDPATPTPADWYSPEVLAAFRLSSKNHCDVPIIIDGKRVHLLASHPTPPVFDGREDRNGLRNQDELRFWRDYVSGDAQTWAYIYDDVGAKGGLPPQEPFIILGDLNGDPHDGDGQAGIRDLLAAPRLLKYPPPESAGAQEQATVQGGINLRHRGEPRFDTIDAPERSGGPGNLRLDYVLPSAELTVRASGVFWPASTEPLYALVADPEHPSTDHRLVWVDVELPAN